MSEYLINFTDYCKNFAKHELEELKGWKKKVYACDLANEVTNEINCNGTATYSTGLARRYLNEWGWEAGEFFDYEKNDFGENIHNPFSNPEAYMVAMVIEGINTLLSQCVIIDDNWNDEVELTDEFIDTLITQIDECGEINFN